VLSASKRDFASTQKTWSALISAIIDHYNCKRRCNRSFKYYLIDENGVYYVMLEQDFTALINLIELSCLTSMPYTVYS